MAWRRKPPIAGMGDVFLLKDLLFSVGTVAPLLLVMAAGYVARRLGIMRTEGVKQANSAVFHVFLPIMLGLNVMETQHSQAMEGGVLLYAMGAVLLSFMVMALLARRVSGEARFSGVFIQGVARSNYAIYGIPLVMQIYPAADISLAALMVVAVVPLFNVLSTIVLMVYSGKAVRHTGIIRGVLLNPLIIGTLLGFLLWQLGVTLPAVVHTPLKMLASIATPLALFLLGASLDFAKARVNGRLLWLGVMGRLVMVPLIFLGIAVALGIRDMSLAVLIAVFASPTAVSSYPMAQQIGGDTDYAAAQVVFTTALSSLTVFLWVFAAKAAGFLR